MDDKLKIKDDEINNLEKIIKKININLIMMKI